MALVLLIVYDCYVLSIATHFIALDIAKVLFIRFDMEVAFLYID